MKFWLSPIPTWWFDSIGKKPSVKADLAIYDQVLGVSGWYMSAAFTYRQKMDISYCGNKASFHRPGHIFC